MVEKLTRFILLYNQDIKEQSFIPGGKPRGRGRRVERGRGREGRRR